MALVITILALALLFKLTGLLLGICGKALAVVLSLVGYLILGVILVMGFSITFLAIPGLLLLGGCMVAGRIARA